MTKITLYRNQIIKQYLWSPNFELFPAVAVQELLDFVYPFAFADGLRSQKKTLGTFSPMINKQGLVKGKVISPL